MAATGFYFSVFFLWKALGPGLARTLGASAGRGTKFLVLLVAVMGYKREAGLRSWVFPRGAGIFLTSLTKAGRTMRYSLAAGGFEVRRATTPEVLTLLLTPP